MKAKRLNRYIKLVLVFKNFHNSLLVCNLISLLNHLLVQHTSLRVYPQLVIDAVNAMCPVRRDWVESAGFSSILELKVNKVDRHFMTWLEKRWDWKRQVLVVRDDYGIAIDEEMISWITGIPFVDQDFESMTLGNDEVEEFETAYNTRSGIDYTHVYNKCSIETDRLWFLRHFILLTMGSLFCMNKYNFITPKLLPLLKKDYVSNPSEWNWCGFVYDWMTGRGKEPGKPSAFVLLVSEQWFFMMFTNVLCY